MPDGTALAVRSCGGLVPLYLHSTDDGVLCVGTLLSYFPRFIPARFRPDALINASWDQTLTFIDGRSFVAGISVLPRGSYTALLPGRPPQGGVYWDPRPAEGDEPEPSPEHPRELRRLLIEKLSEGLDPGGRNLLLLSGGVDSASVGALSAGTLGRGLSSWSLIPAADPDRSRELSYIDPLVSTFGIEPAHQRELTEEIHRSWVTAAPGLPFQILHPALCDLPRVCAEQEVRVLVCGMFADEVCGHVQRWTDWANYTSLWSLMTGATAPYGQRSYYRWARRRVSRALGRYRLFYPKELPSWAPLEVKTEYDEWRTNLRASRAKDRRPLPGLADRMMADGFVAMNWEGTAPLGVRRVLPFFNREVLELAFQCHPRELLGPGPKVLLREAVREDVPARNLMRPDRGAWSSHIQTGIWNIPGDGLPAAAAQVVRSDWLPEPPSTLSFYEGTLMFYATRVAEYLDRQAARDEARAA